MRQRFDVSALYPYPPATTRTPGRSIFFEADAGNAEPAEEPVEPAEPVVEEPAVEEPGDEPSGSYADPPVEPPEWTTRDRQVLVLPFPAWWRWRGWSPPYPPPLRPAGVRPTWPRAVGRLRRVVSNARRIGTIRSRRSGARYPVYRSRLGGRSYRIVTRPRGSWRQEIVLIHPATPAPQQETFPLGASSERRSDALATTPEGYRLRLPHARIHALLSRLHPHQVRRLAGGSLDGDPAPAVAATIGRLARQARRVGTFAPPNTGAKLPVFSAAGYRILVRPLSPTEGEILTVAPGGVVEGEVAASAGIRTTLHWEGPFQFGKKAVLTPRPQSIDLQRDGGIYIIEQSDGVPIYVGKADRFGPRLETRREVLRQMAVPLGGYRIRLGKASPQDQKRLTALEHVVLRAIINRRNPPQGDRSRVASFWGSSRRQSLAPLTNLSPRAPFPVRGAVDVSFTGRAPAYLGRGITASPGEWFEVGG